MDGTLRDHLRDAWLRFRFRMRYPREEYSPLAARFAISCSLPPLTRSLRRLNRALRFAALSATMLGWAMVDPSPESECFMVRLPT